ncbi:hypothetical protein HID58_077749 [Brassica napus]|uniref:Uncharacterized protein n=1 Tax=Brassica napus TaxID=3708 RepID=A0ABQ7YRI5_BRANA|nr:hypothetical protein HID58_077749 [Brassica napus]
MLGLSWNDGLHFRQPWVMAVEEEVERLKQRVHDHDKLLRECEALKICNSLLEGWESGWLILSDSTEVEYKRRGHGLSRVQEKRSRVVY